MYHPPINLQNPVEACTQLKTSRLTDTVLLRYLSANAHQIIRTNDLIQLLLDQGTNINHADEQGLTALMCASRSFNTETVALLLKHPEIDVNLRNESGATALMMACRNFDKKTAEMLMEHPTTDLHVKDNEGRQAISWARYNGAFWIKEKIAEVEKQRREKKAPPVARLGEDCLICTDKLTERWAVVPCGHTGLCMSCLEQQEQRTRLCPICRQTIEGKLRIF
jgi:hypothetical protein